MHSLFCRAVNCTFHLVREEMEQLVYMFSTIGTDAMQHFTSAFNVVEVCVCARARVRVCVM